jgi:hypothetical protein
MEQQNGNSRLTFSGLLVIDKNFSITKDGLLIQIFKIIFDYVILKIVQDEMNLSIIQQVKKNQQ